MLNIPGRKNNKEVSSGPQGITTGANALHRLAAQALVILLLPLLAGFAYLIAIREPGLQTQQIGHIASAFATQQATNIHHLQSRLQARIQAAAKSPEAQLAIASGTAADLSAAEKAMLTYFPELMSLQIMPIGDMGTSGFTSDGGKLRNHIEVDLVRLTSQGTKTSAESYQYEGKWITSMAEQVSTSDPAQRGGVVFVTLDNQLLSKQLASLHTSAGAFALEQHFSSDKGGERQDVIASTHNASPNKYTSYVNIPESSWRVSFTPSDELLQSLEIGNTSLLTVLLMCIFAIITGLALLVIRFPRILHKEVEKVISAADKKTALQLELPELVTIAKQLRRATLRSKRQRSAAPASAPIPTATQTVGGEITSPLFRGSTVLDLEEDQVLELDIEADQVEQDSPQKGFPHHIFRAYDIRGIASTELSDELVASIGSAIGSMAAEQGEQTLIVGGDGRESSGRIKSALIRALMESGRDVIDIGMVCTPQLYFATHHLNCRSGVMVTGSHNPAEYNGLKIVINRQTIAAGGIQQIRERAQIGKFTRGSGRMIREDVTAAYTDEVVSDIAISMPLKIVIDAGNGAASHFAPELFAELGCDVVPLHCHVDGTFPNHPPDTSNEDNLKDLVQMVKQEGADLGVAFDGDGDRLAVVTPTGRIVRSDLLLMIYAQDVVSRNPGADVVFDVKCTRNLTQLVTQCGGRPVLWKTGHAFMKEKMAETGALLGGEFSGHMFFGERWFGFDDGMYAAARLAEILSTHGNDLDTVLADFPSSVNTPEIIIPIDEQDKFATMENFISSAAFPDGKINTLDGLRVDFNDGWGLVRASNTTAALTARFEATTQESLVAIQHQFRGQLELIDPTLDLTF